MRTATCRACQGTRHASHYLCRACWNALPGGTRLALNQRGPHALARLRRLYDQIDAGTALADVRVIEPAAETHIDGWEITYAPGGWARAIHGDTTAYLHMHRPRGMTIWDTYTIVVDSTLPVSGNRLRTVPFVKIEHEAAQYTDVLGQPADLAEHTALAQLAAHFDRHDDTCHTVDRPDGNQPR